MPMVHGILETALYVAHVRRAAEFYRRIFGFGTLLENDRLIALDVAGRSVLLLFHAGSTKQPFTLRSGGTIPGHGDGGPTHFAFSIALEDVESWQRHLRSMEIEIESVVNWPASEGRSSGAVSIYFRDPDQNLVELITPCFWRTF